MRSKPVISFCIPTFNRANRVYECVKHILSYKSSDIEVVVSNNASADNTVELLATIEDPRLRIISNEENIAALNWPLAVSRATGGWAVLMSDEDIVELDNIPYYIDNLLKPDIGLILYSFPPFVNQIDYTYICGSQSESLYSVIKHGGHITGAVHNMSKLEIKDLDHYRDYVYPPTTTMKCEPQLQMCIDNATVNKVLLTDIPICSYGKVERKQKRIKKSEPAVNNQRRLICGYEPFYRIHHMEAHASHISRNTINPPYALYNAALRCVMLTIGKFYGRLLTQKSDDPDILLWDELREAYNNCGRDEAASDLCNYFDEAIKCLIELTKNEHWNRWIDPFRQIINQQYSSHLPQGMTPTEGILFGDAAFSIILQFYRNYDSGAIIPEENFAADFGDSLGMKSRETLRTMIRDKEYGIAVALDVPDNVRTRYYKGEAYFRIGDLERAEDCFGYVIKKVFNPETLDDIIINEIAVQYSLYYMGIISKRKGKLEDAEKYFSDCGNLSDELLIRANLASRNLPAIP